MIIQPFLAHLLRQTLITMSQTLCADLASHLNGICALPHLGVIQAQGEEAANFLHNQLTNDVLLLSVGQARLAAFCSRTSLVDRKSTRLNSSHTAESRMPSSA